MKGWWTYRSVVTHHWAPHVKGDVYQVTWHTVHCRSMLLTISARAAIINIFILTGVNLQYLWPCFYVPMAHDQPFHKGWERSKSLNLLGSYAAFRDRTLRLPHSFCVLYLFQWFTSQWHEHKQTNLFATDPHDCVMWKGPLIVRIINQLLFTSTKRSASLSSLFGFLSHPQTHCLCCLTRQS